MTHKIFLSHNHADKPVVEPVALRLAQIFGESAVFYDSWSIRPGDGIIDQMNNGLEAPEFVFFFVSANSLASQMVKLEWQNALHSATRGNTRMIPVRVDESAMPALLTQTLYIDMYTSGIEAAIAQIVSVTQGSSSFTPQHQGFSNLSYSAVEDKDGSMALTINASHLMEPNGSFVIITSNAEEDISCEMANGQAHFGGFNRDKFVSPTGDTLHGILFRMMGGAITPKHPLRIKVNKLNAAALSVIAVLHEGGENQWNPIPYKA
ncbi:TIR domain-containing protein [Pseudomonas sp. 2848]|uniref:toll/interleukin-1 receptor domain-containing protein n=1 Tax=Pseudomonas sp. 2848 TaxID=2183926 RepID=UPI000DABB1AC|nr:toll/interleukin-1 receptor domain-containing protein [Pseudomonas sp. 2848]PZW77322.1 TIR domain-containing protein [Pseudomonas sp. 2848]